MADVIIKYYTNKVTGERYTPTQTKVGKNTTVYSSPNVRISGSGGRITDVAVKNPTSTASSNSAAPELLFEDTGSKTRVLTPFEAAAVKATSGGMTKPDGSTEYVSVQVTKPAAQTIKEQKTKPQAGMVMATKDAYPGITGTKAYRKVSEQVITPLKEGFTLKKTQSYDYRGDTASPVQRISYAAGLVGSIASVKAAAPAAKTAGATAKTVFSAPVTAYRTFLTKLPNKASVFLASTAVNVGGSYAVAKTTYNIGVRAQDKTTREAIRSGAAKATYDAGVAYGTKDLNFIQRTAAATPVLGDVVYPKNSRVRQKIDEGVVIASNNNPSLVRASQRYAAISNTAFVASAAFSNTASEIGGQAAFTMDKTYTVASSQAFKTKFWQGFRNIAPQGLAEGAGISVGLQASQGKNLRTINYKEVAFSSALGGVTAGTLGGTIYAAKPAVSKGLLGVAYATEPLEAAGDYIGGLGSGKVSGGITKAKTFTFVPSLTDTMTRTSTTTTTNTIAKTASTTPAMITQRTTAYTPAPSTTPSSTFSFSSVFSLTSSRTTTPTNTPTSTTALTNTPTTTPTVTNTYVPTTTPTVTTTVTTTPEYGFPIIPLGRGGGRGGGAGLFRTIGFGGYTPSATALALNIRGKRSKTYRTGLGVRPIE
jgi:hypothetical protein